MEKRIEFSRALGIPKDAHPEEVEERCEALLGWLDSSDLPEDLRSWAAAQRALAQEVLKYGGLPQEEATAAVQAVARAPAASPPPVARARRPRTSLSGLLTKPLALVAGGALLGLAVVGILWWRGIIFPSSPGLHAQAAQENFDPAKFLASSQARLKELERVVSSNPKDANALFELGETYVTGQDWEKAILWFTRLLEVDPNNVHARLDIGYANMSLGRYAEADTSFRQALLLDPSDVQGHYNLGFLSAFRRDAPNMEEALRHWKEVVRLAPDSDLAKVAQVHIDQLGSAGGTSGKQ